jgi:hypothetical protein
MALSANVTQHGKAYEFGFPSDASPPEFGDNFVPRSAELRYEAEVFAQAQDGEGHTDSIVTSSGDFRKITGTFTGYILADYDVADIPASFVFLERNYITRNVSVPRRKGEFAEVTVEAESYGGIPAVTTP